MQIMLTAQSHPVFRHNVGLVTVRRPLADVSERWPLLATFLFAGGASMALWIFVVLVIRAI
jgi:hypothetical protein